jgi:hypothetical protein
MEDVMRRYILISIAFSVMVATSPTSAAAQPENVSLNCVTKGETTDVQSGKQGKPARGITPAQQQAQSKCAASRADSHADLWMITILLLGGIVIGVPAARRRNVRVVFS